MHYSALDFFTIGIGPSSSHTVGPMRAAKSFTANLLNYTPPDSLASVRCDLFGSLATTGKGHGTDKALILGFLGESPDSIDPASKDVSLNRI